MIWQVEISKYNKDWMQNALKLLSSDMVKENAELLRQLFQEILVNY